MIRCTLNDVMKAKNLSNKEVVELTGVSRNTVTSLQANATKRIDYETLDALCRGLKVDLMQIIEYVPDN